jgi:hypothetical protein
VIGFKRVSHDLIVPEYTLTNVSVPTKGSVIILNASAEAGSASEGFLVNTFSESSGSTHLIESISNGFGIKSITASKRSCTHAFFNADHTRTGYNPFAITHVLIAFLISSSDISSPPRNFSANSSLNNDNASIIASLLFFA